MQDLRRAAVELLLAGLARVSLLVPVPVLDVSRQPLGGGEAFFAEGTGKFLLFALVAVMGRDEVKDQLIGIVENLVALCTDVVAVGQCGYVGDQLKEIVVTLTLRFDLALVASRHNDDEFLVDQAEHVTHLVQKDQWHRYCGYRQPQMESCNPSGRGPCGDERTSGNWR